MLKVVKTLDLQTAFNNARVDVVWLKFVFSTWLYSTHWLMLCYNVNLTCGWMDMGWDEYVLHYSYGIGIEL